MSLIKANPPLILASASTIRAQLLRQAGIEFTAQATMLDEDAIKIASRQEGLSASATAENLAWAKAQLVSNRQPDKVIIGCDQMLECDGVWYDKPGNITNARQQLMALAGREQRLYSAVMVVKNGQRLWSHVAESRLTLRPLSADDIDDYLHQAGESVWHSVGVIHYEGLGLQLIDQVRGDYYAILGMPLLPLLGYLRQYYAGFSGN